MGLIRGLIRDALGEIRGARNARRGRRRGSSDEVREDGAYGEPAQQEGGYAAARPRRDGSEEGDRKGIVKKVVEGVQKMRQEGGLYAEGDQGPRPQMDVEKTAEWKQPQSGANALSKKRCYFGVLLMGFVLAADWMATLVSIQALYYLMQGPKRLYGLTFSVYDLATLLAVLVYTPWSHKTGQYKMPMLLGTLVAMAGNFLYACVVVADRWWVILIARAISGAGSAVVYLGEPYLSSTTGSHGENDVKSVRFRGFQSAGQQIMMLVGMIFLRVNTVTEDSSTATKLFNFYTLQGWLLALLILFIVVPFWLWLFQDPSQENEHLEKKPEEPLPEPTPQQLAEVASLKQLFILSSFITIFGMVGFLSNLFGLAAGQYHTVHEQNDLFNPFLPVGLGGLGAGIVYKAAMGQSRRQLPVPPAAADERFLLVLCNVFLFAAWMLTIPWCGKSCRPTPALFYVAASLVGVVSTLYLIAMSKFMKGKAEQHRAVVQRQGSPFKLVGPCLLAAKFLGPLIIGLVTYMATPSGDTNVCTGTVDNDLCLPNDTSQALPQDQCIVLGDKYYVEGCVLYNAIIYYPIMAGLQLLNCLLCLVLVTRHGSYKRA
ncbi:hypothetical protein ABPG75_006319 [Micractinium tetrahymenae]